MDPKLIQARAEIQAILEKHDIAGHVVLHNAPGNFEVFMWIEPSYSKLRREGTERDGLTFRLRSKLADYGGDAPAQQRDLTATAALVGGMSRILTEETISFMQLATIVDRATNATHGELYRTDGTVN